MRDAAELVVCCEVLEHLEDPDAALETLAGLARPWLIVERPARAAVAGAEPGPAHYVGELGNTPGHLNHWSQARVPRFLARAGRAVEVRSPLPWTMALCRSDRRESAPRLDLLRHRRWRAPGAAAIVCLGHRLGLTMHSTRLGPARPLRPGARLRRRPGRDRPLALGDQRQGLDRRALLLGQVARGGGALAPRSTWRSTASAGSRRRPRRGAQRRATPSSRAGRRAPTRRSRTTATTASASDRGRAPDRGGRADDLGADPARGGDPGGAAAASWCAGSATGSSPGYGTAAAITLGLATIVMIFASEYFSHVIAAALGFAAFLLLMRERDGRAALGAGRARPALLAGLAVHLRVPGRAWSGWSLVLLRARPLGDVAAAGRAPSPPARSLGVLPALAFNPWALGVAARVRLRRRGGRAGLQRPRQLGLNDDGFFGITVPRLDAAVELLLADRGLLVLTP